MEHSLAMDWQKPAGRSPTSAAWRTATVSPLQIVCCLSLLPTDRLGGQVDSLSGSWWEVLISRQFVAHQGRFGAAVNVVDSWSLRALELIEALGLLPSGHLVRAMMTLSGLDGELSG